MLPHFDLFMLLCLGRVLFMSSVLIGSTFEQLVPKFAVKACILIFAQEVGYI